MPTTEPLYRLSVVRRILNDLGIRPAKRLGQNFLVDKNTVERILACTAAGPGDAILEIGPGLGVLTQGLLARGAAVVAIEKDRRLVGALKELFGAAPGFTLLHADALTVDLAAVLSDGAPRLPQGSPPVYKAVSNLPYYVTSPLLMHLLESPVPFERIVVMVQKEVAERLTATPGSSAYGALTVAVQYRADVVPAFTVPPTVFYPPPSVLSQVLILRPRPSPHPVGQEELFFQVVRSAFGKRRKTLANALRDVEPDPERVRRALARAGIDPQRRGETLSLAEFANVSRALAAE